MGNLQLKNLTDFQEMIAPTLIRILYWIGLVVIGLGALVQLVMALGSMGQSFIAGLGMVIGVLVGVVFAVLFWRVMCELYIILFRIYERLGEIVQKEG